MQICLLFHISTDTVVTSLLYVFLHRTLVVSLLFAVAGVVLSAPVKGKEILCIVNLLER